VRDSNLSSGWENLQSLAFNKFPNVENNPGIYFIRWKKFENPVTINRLGGSDDAGLLYIGESKDLRRRFQRLWRGIKKVDEPKNTAFYTLRKSLIFCKLHQEIKSDEYEIAWQHVSTKLEAQVQQAVALKLYTEKYKEPPPLNLKVCEQKYLKWGINPSDYSRWNGKANDFVKSIIS
jgi:hypothetical protein